MMAANLVKFQFCNQNHTPSLSLPLELSFLSSIYHLFDSNIFKLKEKIRIHFFLNSFFSEIRIANNCHQIHKIYLSNKFCRLMKFLGS